MMLKMTNNDTISEGRIRARQLKVEIDHFYDSYLKSLNGVEMNFQGELHKYACIRLAGFLEQLFHVSVYSYVRATSSPTTGAFATSFWKNAPNLNPDALRRLIARFDSDEWGASLESLAEEEEVMDRLGVLLRVRNDTSHGKSYSGTRANVSTYKSAVDTIYKWVVHTFLAEA
ncbi:hypothetical protein [Mycolicibacterium sp. XJ775]